jgi:ABC-type antimicrobial peptide transport system permease subunit
MIAYVNEALLVLLANKTRTILTMTGLIIGVTAVISIQVLGAGMAGAITGILGSISERSFSVFPNNRQRDFTRAALRVSEVERAKDAVGNIAVAEPIFGTSRRIAYGNRRIRLRIAADADARFLTTPVRLGEAFTHDQVERAAHVCLVTDDAATKLGLGEDAIGKTLRMGDRRCTITAVLGPSKTGIVPNIVQGDIFIPYTTFERDYVQNSAMVGVRFIVEDETQIGPTESRMIAYLERLKHGRAEYQTFDRKTFSTAVDAIFGGLTLVVAIIGAVSLLVAGIGILNIMLVSVAERTREIGIRKAIGATRFQILIQFFIEALLLSSIGCAVGLVLGLTLGGLVNDFGIVKISGFVAPIPWLRSTAIAVGFATIVTLAFGTYPAYRAARLDPIEALRYE